MSSDNPNPFRAPEAELHTQTTTDLSKDYPGIGRLAYFGFGILNLFVGVLVGGILMETMGEEAGLGVAGIMLIAGSIFLTYKRLINIGDSGWFCLLLFLPLVNALLGIRCLGYPTGYKESQTLDTAGKIIVVILGILVLLSFIGNIIDIASRAG